MEITESHMIKPNILKQFASKVLETDAYLIDCILNHDDKNAAEILIERHYKTVYKEIYIRTSDKELSMDLTQETFISILRALVQFDEAKSSFKTWIKKIAHNKVIDYQRSRQHHESLLTGVIDDFDELSTDSVEDNAMNVITAEKADEILAKEDEETRRVFELKVHEGFTFGEISEITGLNISAVKRKYYGLVKKLRKEMQDYE